jgi:hypothetical protein
LAVEAFDVIDSLVRGVDDGPDGSLESSVPVALEDFRDNDFRIGHVLFPFFFVLALFSLRHTGKE